MKIERIGNVSGRKVSYRLVVDDVNVGRIEKKRAVDPVIGGPRTSRIVWVAKAGPYGMSSGFQTQAEAEQYLMPAAEQAIA